MLVAELSGVEGVLAASNKDDSCALTNTWAKIVVDLSNISNKRIVLLNSQFLSSHFCLYTELRAIKRLKFVITPSIDSIPVIGSSSNLKTIALYNFAASNSSVACVCLSFTAKSISSYTLLTQIANYSTTVLNSSCSTWVLELISSSTNSSMCILT